MINFHTDFALKTLQLSLNSDEEYFGGCLVYATNGKIIQSKRNKGTVTIHNNKIVHGVTLLQKGIRYGLFMLQK
jgi:predicted 2-oxoglutarate/Fe(II)-dependent dioxygenase YbiX